MKPGEYFLGTDPIEINSGAQPITLEVANTADRPVQVGSHFHFFETNRALQFDRAQSYGRRLNIPSGTAIRFEPGQVHIVELIPFGGLRTVYGFNNLVDGGLDTNKDVAAQKVADYINE